MNSKQNALLASLVLFGLAACSTEESGSGSGAANDAPKAADAMPADGLAGTSWQLVQINSMDDSVTTPDERAKYTLSFQADGTVAVRADCNRGTGGWTSESANQLQFGALATTRAMCPPDSLHDRFLSELSYVRSYVLEDGNLHLATMADGSIIDFEPLPGE